jgi:phage replication-related protein YjqB (UPF0714/DUF867 family)
MVDKYSSWSELVRSEGEGVGYIIQLTLANSRWLVIAPHGGGIEPGTTEIARAIAGSDWSFYSVEGIKSSNNKELHITSHRFDEPRFLRTAPKHESIVAIHGCEDSRRDKRIRVWVGGGDEGLAERMIESLSKGGFPAALDTHTPGKEPTNVCNRGRTRKGIQLELSKSLRDQFVEGLDRTGRKSPRPALSKFSSIVREVLAKSP